MKPTDEQARQCLSDESINEIHSWSKDTLRQNFIDLMVECIKMRVELTDLKNPKIILPKL